MPTGSGQAWPRFFRPASSRLAEVWCSTQIAFRSGSLFPWKPRAGVLLLIHQPENDAQHHADDERGHQRKVEGKARPLDSDVAGKPAEPKPADERPDDTGGD